MNQSKINPGVYARMLCDEKTGDFFIKERGDYVCMLATPCGKGQIIIGCYPDFVKDKDRADASKLLWSIFNALRVNNEGQMAMVILV